jgi:chloramphenicol 3-O phosphotransferase
MVATPWIVLLSGASSSGKSSLGRALLDLVRGPTVLVEADAAFPSVRGWSGDFGVSAPIVVFHRGVVAWLDAGANLIIDGSLPYGDLDLRQQCLEELPSSRTVIVGVVCSIEELRRREATRPEARQIGWAERQARDVNDGLDLLVTVDTTHGDAENHARHVLAAIDASDS